ncbi:MAG: hypothetical protein KDN20_24960 [Verrucomicrobiae bacterium]|nr:hypothetical protein [Verrucomicrobiae bacterium]
MKKPIWAFTLIAGLFLGWGTRELLDTKLDIRRHWQRIDDYNAFIRDPKNYTNQGGFSQTSPSIEIRDHADALVGFGELMREEIIVPGLRNERSHIQRWMEFANDPGIVHAEGPGSFQQGEIPLMFTLWYRPEAKARVHAMIDEFEELAASLPKSEAEP